MKRLLGCMLLTILGIGAAHSQTLPPGMIMHRAQAGTLDASGWTRADSTMGAFSVSLPCKFNDFMVNDDKPDSPTRRAYALGCTSAGHQRLSAARIEYRGGAAAAQSYFDKLSGAAAPGMAKGSGKHAGLSFVDREVSDAKQCALTRVIHAPPDNLLLIVEMPDCAGLEPLAGKFFGSLVVKPRS
jgi:hypothetical protein